MGGVYNEMSPGARRVRALQGLAAGAEEDSAEEMKKELTDRTGLRTILEAK